MKVQIERYVQQVEDGRSYRGEVVIAGTKLTYEFDFGMSISELENAPPQGIDAVRKAFQIKVKKDAEIIDLGDEEFALFLFLLGEFVIDFFYCPQTRDSQEGTLGQAMRGEGVLAEFGIKASIGMRSSGACDLPEKACKLLTEKFGVKLAA